MDTKAIPAKQDAAMHHEALGFVWLVFYRFSCAGLAQIGRAPSWYDGGHRFETDTRTHPRVA